MPLIAAVHLSPVLPLPLQLWPAPFSGWQVVALLSRSQQLCCSR
jgi:hypothetical protein